MAVSKGLGKRSTGLGKGLEALIPTDFDPSLLIDSQDRVQKLFVKDIQPNPEQPRREFAPEPLEELAQSIKRFGILQPLIVSPAEHPSLQVGVKTDTGAGKTYVIVAGERRWRAAQIAGLTQVPAIVRKEQELERLEIALIENVQRVDLSPMEQAVSIEKLHSQFNMGYADIARRLGKAVSTINNIVRLLQLPPAAIEALQSNKISEGHARAVLALKHDPDKQAELLQNIIEKGWSVRQAEQFVISAREDAHDAGKDNVRSRLDTTTPETEKLSKNLKTPVSIRRTAKGGRLEIHFKSDDHLSDLIKKLGS